ncbi:MAG: hypothetical protein ACJ739_16360 [Acidimicrobiales bacterium]
MSGPPAVRHAGRGRGSGPGIGRRLLVAALALGLAAGAAACGDDDGAEGQPIPPTTVEPGSLPPPDALDLEPLYGEALAAVGMKLTDRGGLIDRSGGGYVPSPTGRHLALYVEPIAPERTMDEYFDGIRDVAAVFSDIYDRWPLLETYDVCQEPPDPDGTQDPEPLPVTQIELDRAQSEAIAWDTVTVEDLVRGAQQDPPAIVLRVSTEMADHPPYAALVGGDSGAPDDPYSTGQ